MKSGSTTREQAVSVILFITLMLIYPETRPQSRTEISEIRSSPVEQTPLIRPPSRYEIMGMVLEEAERSTVPPYLALAVAKVESDFDADALSSAGACGVMQIMPRTGREEFGVARRDLWDARLNIKVGIYFLARLHRQYGEQWNLALSHYNGGTLRGRGRYATPHTYTRGYVKSVYWWWNHYERSAVAQRT